MVAGGRLVRARCMRRNGKRLGLLLFLLDAAAAGAVAADAAGPLADLGLLLVGA